MNFNPNRVNMGQTSSPRERQASRLNREADSIRLYIAQLENDALTVGLNTTGKRQLKNYRANLAAIEEAFAE